jgi:hypothetical protein
MIILPHAAMPSWHGIDPPPPGAPAIVVRRRITRSGPATDYDRACDAEGVVVPLALDAGEALVLGNYVDNAAWLAAPRGHQGGAIVRVMTVADEGALETEVLRLIGTQFPPSDVEWRVAERRQWLFSAADRSDEGERSGIEIDLDPGLYEIRTIHFDDPNVGEAMIHRVVPKSASATGRREPSPSRRNTVPAAKQIRNEREVLTPGDVLEIEHEGEYGYVAYVGPHFVYNDAIWVIPRVFTAPVTDYCALFEHSGYMIFYLARQALRRHQVRKVGHCVNAIKNVPKTLRFMSKTDPDGFVTLWNISGEGIKDLLVTTLSEEQQVIPIAENWNHATLIARIRDGWTPDRYSRTLGE